MSNAKITGYGYYVPEKVYDNAYMEQIVETNDEWITQRTGIKERRIAKDNEYTSDMATEAARMALEDAHMAAEALDLIIVATITADYHTPSCACVVQKNIGAAHAAAFDINAACSGFVTALAIAKQFIENGTYQKILIIGADTLSKITDYKDRGTCILFGDAAGAAVLEASAEPGVMAVDIGANGADGMKLTSLDLKADAEETEKRVGKDASKIFMAGAEVMKFAVKIMAEAASKVVAEAGLTMDDIALIVPHQANTRIIYGASKRMGISDDKVFVNIQKYGNTSGASIPVALYEAVKSGRAKPGDKIVLVGFGGGLTWGAAVLQV